MMLEGPNDPVKCWGVFGYVGGPGDDENAGKYTVELFEYELDA